MAGRLETAEALESWVSAIVEGAVVAGVPGCNAESRLMSSLRCDRAIKDVGLFPGAVLGLRRLFSHDFGEELPPRE